MSKIEVKVVADSVSSVDGKRITTFELQYPRFIHAEFMTHRMVSKNSASSRAIPVKTMLETIRNNPAMPSHWGKNEPGMQANEECNEYVELNTYLAGDWQNYETRGGAWNLAKEQACIIAEAFSDAGYHKQIVNRLTEPFQMIKVVATATEWDNFFWLRKHKDAQPEIRILAERMYQARAASTPEVLHPGEWHVPYVPTVRFDDGQLRYCSWLSVRVLPDGTKEKTFNEITKEDALKVSASMCAQVSYRKADQSLEKALMIYDRLVESKPVHASPFEHQATPMRLTRGIDYFYEGINSGKPTQDNTEWQEGITAEHRVLGLMSGNFAGWIQNRQLIPNNTCWDYKESVE